MSSQPITPADYSRHMGIEPPTAPYSVNPMEFGFSDSLASLNRNSYSPSPSPGFHGYAAFPGARHGFGPSAMTQYGPMLYPHHPSQGQGDQSGFRHQHHHGHSAHGAHGGFLVPGAPPSAYPSPSPMMTPNTASIASPTPAPATAARAAARKGIPTDKTAAKRLLNEVEVTARIDLEIKKWTQAGMSAIYTDLTKAAQARIDTMLQKYSLTITAFRAQVLQANGTEDLQPSDDGNTYMRVNHHSLGSYFSALADLERAVTARLDGLEATMEEIKLVLSRMETSSVANAASVSASGSSSLLRTSVPDPVVTLKDHSKAPALTRFRILLNQCGALAVGRGAEADSEPKLYDQPYPVDPANVIYHPSTYKPLPGEVPVVVTSPTGETTNLYPVLRFRFDRGYDVSPNKEGLAPILDDMMENAAAYGIPSSMSKEELMRRYFKRTWEHMRQRYRELNRPDESPDEVKARWKRTNQVQRRRKRVVEKGARRLAEAKKLILGSAGSRSTVPPGQPAHDGLQPVLFREDLQSAEESMEESVPGTPTKRKSRVRMIPECRSEEATRFLRSLDTNNLRRVALIESDKRAPAPDVPAQTRKWMVHAEYVNQNPDCSRMLLPNVGPFTGKHSVATSADMLGSMDYGVVPYVPAAAGTSALDRLFGTRRAPVEVADEEGDGDDSRGRASGALRALFSAQGLGLSPSHLDVDLGIETSASGSRMGALDVDLGIGTSASGSRMSIEEALEDTLAVVTA